MPIFSWSNYTITFVTTSGIVKVFFYNKNLVDSNILLCVSKDHKKRMIYWIKLLE